MEITEVRIKLMEDAGQRLRAFCSITLDDSFVIRDLKIIEGTNGLFVAMPSRKLTARCSKCGCKNHLRAAYCNQCGVRLRDDRAGRDDSGRVKLYADIAHPINSACRERMQQRIIEAFGLEQERSKQPGYVPSYQDFDDDYDDHLYLDPKSNVTARPQSAQPPQGPHQPRSGQNSQPQTKFGEGIL